jgi:hypothetical protein
MAGEPVAARCAPPDVRDHPTASHAAPSRTVAARGEVSRVRSRQLQAALREYAEQAAGQLQACVLAGEEVPFELDSRSGRARGAAPLYCYRPLTGTFIAERSDQLGALPAYAHASGQLEAFEGLDRYLLSRGVDPARAGSRGRAQAALLAFLLDIFEEHTDFGLAPERLDRALGRLEGSALAAPAQVTLVATLHGLAIASEELPLTGGLLLAQPHALEGAPDQAVRPADALAGSRENHSLIGSREDHLLAVYTAEDADAGGAIAHGGEVLRDLVRALRLFGDGRIALGPLAFMRLAAGPWSAFAVGGGGHPHGMLLVAADQEDELRAFCNLVSRRTPREGPIAWALERFEMGCERAHEYDALSDHLLALRALLAGPGELDPQGSSSGLLAARLAALCATPEHRTALTERTLAAAALEREAIAGTAVAHAGGLEVARDLANHLRALLRDVICGHLPADLVSLADELLLSGAELREEPLGDAGQTGEVLNVAV